MPARKVTFDNGANLWVYEKKPEEDVGIDFIIPYGQVHGPEAHFLEHKLAEDMSPLEGKGIEFNVLTYPDRMHFWVVSPRQNIGLALQALYDVFVNDNVSLDGVESIKGSIEGELLDRKLNPYYNMRDVIRAYLLDFEEETEESVQTMTIPRLVDAKQRYFGPKNLSIAVVGDVDDGIVQIVDDSFGRLKKKGNEKHTFTQPQRRHYEKLEEVDDDSGYVMVVVPVGGINHPNRYALDFISHALGGSRGSYTFNNRLFRELRKKRGLGYFPHASYETYLGVGLLQFGVMGMHKKDANLVKSMLLHELDKIKEPMGEEEFEGVRYSMITAEGRSFYNRPADISGRYAEAGFFCIDPRFEHFSQQINTLTPESVAQVAKEIFDGRYFIAARP